MKTGFNRRDVLHTGLAGAVSVTLPVAAQNNYPSRPVKLICPWPAGGSTDSVMRALAESAARILGSSVLIENKPGASGMLGPNELVKAKPDGYTLSQMVIGVFRMPHMQKTQFNPLTDFTYIIGLTGYTFGIVVRADSPIKSIKDLIAYAKTNPGQFTYGSTGHGTTPHLAVEEFANKAGIQLLHIPFKGGADGLAGVLGGHVMAMSDSSSWASHVDAGTCRLLATYGNKRSKRWPKVPTLHELGYDTISDSPFGIAGPKGMEAAVVRKLHDTFKKTLEDPQVLATFDKYDQSVIYMSTEDYARFAREQFQKEKALIEKLGLSRQG